MMYMVDIHTDYIASMSIYLIHSAISHVSLHALVYEYSISYYRYIEVKAVEHVYLEIFLYQFSRSSHYYRHIFSTLSVCIFCRFIRTVGATDQVSARKFLEAARVADDRMVFYAVFKFFEQRNLRLRGTAAFSKGKEQKPLVERDHEFQ